MANNVDKRKPGRPTGTKNKMRTPEEKEALIQEWQQSGLGMGAFAQKKDVDLSRFRKWIRLYEIEGFEGLIISKRPGNKIAALHTSKNLSELERLRLELIKKEIEIERLKKGYKVEGSGQAKEFINLKGKSSK